MENTDTNLPVFLFYFFRNEKTSPTGIIREEAALRDFFDSFSKSGHHNIQPIFYSNNDLTGLQNELNDISKRILLLHFATYDFNLQSFKILFEPLIGQLHRIRLLILNCTVPKKAMEYFMQQGIPCVITNPEKYDDEYATNFSQDFYRNLLQNMPLRNAFELSANPKPTSKKFTKS